MSERDLDAEFERIIAGWDDEAPDPQLRADEGTPESSPDGSSTTGESGSGESGSPEAGGVGAVDTDAAGAEAGREDPTTPARGGDPGTPASPPGQSSGVLELPIAPTTSHAWRGSEPQRNDVDDLLDTVHPDDDHFVPPSEIDLPSAETDPMYWAIVVGLAGGPLLLLYVLLFDRDGSGWWIVTGLTMLVVGFVLLVLRGGTERDPSDDGTRI